MTRLQYFRAPCMDRHLSGLYVLYLAMDVQIADQRLRISDGGDWTDLDRRSGDRCTYGNKWKWSVLSHDNPYQVCTSSSHTTIAIVLPAARTRSLWCLFLVSIVSAEGLLLFALF